MSLDSLIKCGHFCKQQGGGLIVLEVRLYNSVEGIHQQ